MADAPRIKSLPMFESEELPFDFVENLDTTDELVIDLEDNLLVEDAIMATKTDEVQSIFDELQCSPKMKESNIVTLSSQQGCRPAHPVKVYTSDSRSKSITEGERSEKIENKPDIHVEGTGSSGNADIFPDDQQEGKIIQLEVNVGREVVAGIHQLDEEAKLVPKTNQPLSRRPLRKRSPPEANKQSHRGKHPVNQKLNNMEENIPVIDNEAVSARLSKQLKQKPADLPYDDILPNPRKRKRNNAKFTSTKKTKVSEDRPKRTKRQSESVASTTNHVVNPSKDSNQVIDVQEIMKDMSKLLPFVVVERVAIPRNAAPLKVQLPGQNASSPNEAQEAPLEPEAESSLKRDDNATPTESGSGKPIEENCLTMDVPSSTDKIDENTVIHHASTEVAVISEKMDSILKEKSFIPMERSAAVDNHVLILDVNLEISVEDEDHVELQDLKVSGRKRSASSEAKGKASSEGKPLRSRRGRAAKVVAIKPVGQRKTATAKRRLAVPSSLPSSNGIAEKSEAAINYEKEEIPNVSGLPDNIETLNENEAVDIVAKQQEIEIVDQKEPTLNEGENLSTGEKPPKIRHCRSTRVKVAAPETIIEKTNYDVAIQQINVGKSPTTSVKNSYGIEKATSSSMFRTDSKLYVQMKRVPEVEALVAAMKLEGSKTASKRPRRNMANSSTFPGVKPAEVSSCATVGTRRTRNKKKSF